MVEYLVIYFCRGEVAGPWQVYKLSEVAVRQPLDCLTLQKADMLLNAPFNSSILHSYT